MEYMDIYEVKRSNSQHGFHFFEPGAMRFFNSRISNDAIKTGDVAYFVTSEQFDWKSPRLYTTRKIDLKTGDVDTIGEFQEYRTSQAAWAKIKKLVKEAETTKA